MASRSNRARRAGRTAPASSISYGVSLRDVPRIRREMTGWAQNDGVGGAREWLTKLSKIIAETSENTEFADENLRKGATDASIRMWREALIAGPPLYIDAALGQAIERDAEDLDAHVLTPEDLPSSAGVIAFGQPLRDHATTDPAGIPISLLTWAVVPGRGVLVDLWSSTRYRYRDPDSTGYIFASTALLLHDEKRILRPGVLPARVLPLHGFLFQRTVALDFGEKLGTDALGDRLRAEHTCQDPDCKRCAATRLSADTVRLQQQIAAAWRLTATGRAEATEVIETGARGRKNTPAPGAEHLVIHLHPPAQASAPTAETTGQPTAENGKPTAMPPLTTTATVADLIAYPRTLAERGELKTATAASYRSRLNTLARTVGIADETRLDTLQLEKVRAAFLANTSLSPKSAKEAAALFETMLTRLQISSSSASPAAANTTGHGDGYRAQPGTLGAIPAFLHDHAKTGAITKTSAKHMAAAVIRLIEAAPETAHQSPESLDAYAAALRIAAAHPGIEPATTSDYRSSLRRAASLYSAYLHGHNPAPVPRTTEAPSPQAEPPAVPTTVVELPGQRTVSLTIPADLTSEESKAAAIMLRLHHPGLFEPEPRPAPETGSDGWTLAYWPESAPEVPSVAHITGRTFRAALAAHARAQLGEQAPRHDDDAIEAWYEDHVYKVLAVAGRCDLVDAAVLMAAAP